MAVLNSLEGRIDGILATGDKGDELHRHEKSFNALALMSAVVVYYKRSENYKSNENHPKRTLKTSNGAENLFHNRPRSAFPKAVKLTRRIIYDDDSNLRRLHC